MSNTPIIVEQKLNAPIDKVWQAITDKDKMIHWYFEIEEFRSEVGFVFSFYAGGEEEKYLHECKILEVKKNELLSYSWVYPDLSGYSVVTFRLSPNASNSTLLKLEHEGVETFPKDNPLFSRDSFRKGWQDIIGLYLKEYVEGESSE